MNNFFLALIISLVLFSQFTSCKSRRSNSSAVKSTPTQEVDKCDLASMDKQSKKASTAAYQCAYNSLTQAGKLAGGGYKQVVDFLDGAFMFKSYFDDYRNLLDLMEKNRGQGCRQI